MMKKLMNLMKLNKKEKNERRRKEKKETIGYGFMCFLKMNMVCF